MMSHKEKKYFTRNLFHRNFFSPQNVLSQKKLFNNLFLFLRNIFFITEGSKSKVGKERKVRKVGDIGKKKKRNIKKGSK